MPQEKFNILVLEDDHDDVYFIEDLLSDMGISKDDYNIFSNFESLLDYVDLSIHMFILDDKIGSKSGYETFLKIRERNRGSWIIIFSGYDDKDTILKYMNSDADRYVSKNDTSTWRNELKQYLLEGFKEAKANVEWIEWLKLKKQENEQRTL